MYTLAEKTPVLEQEDGQLVLRAWNIHSNSYRDIPLITEDGAQPQIGLDHITSSEGSVSRDGSHYRWVAWEDGKVRSVNLTSGVVRELFTLDLSHYNSGESKFFFTDTSVFVLDVNAKRDELKFSHYIASLTARKQTTSLLKASPMWIGYECHAISSETSPLTPHGSRCTTAEGIFGTLALSPVSAPPISSVRSLSCQWSRLRRWLHLREVPSRRSVRAVTVRSWRQCRQLQLMPSGSTQCHQLFECAAAGEELS